MSISREHYNEIMRIISERHFAAVREKNARQDEVYEAVPAFRVYDERLSELRSLETEAMLRKNGERVGELRAERKKLSEKKNKLLISSGYPEDYLNIHYHCAACGDTGFIGSEKCGCFKQLESIMLNRESGLPSLMERENFSTFDMSVFDNERPIEELLPKRITQYEYMKGHVLPRIKKYLDSFEAEGSHNILLFGPAGTGKTFLSNCIAKALIERQHSVVYERAGDMFRAMSKAEFANGKNDDADYIGQRVTECELLILDDLGTEFSTEYTRSRLYSIISDRLSYGLSTIISTNMSMNQICSDYGERISSRFMGQYMLLPFYGTDLRVIKSKGV